MDKPCKSCGNIVVGCNNNHHQVNCPSCRKNNQKRAQRSWDSQHPEKIKKILKKYYSAHPEVAARKTENQRYVLRTNLPRRLYYSAKARAKRKNLNFSIVSKDIVVPERCPALGIHLHVGNKCVCDNSPSLDRIDSLKGYTKTNIHVISHKANTMKSNATIRELELLVDYLKGISCTTSA